MEKIEEEIYRKAPIMYGEALELGFFLGIAAEANNYDIEAFAGVRITPPILDVGNKISLDKYLEKILGIQIEQAIDLFIRKSRVGNSYPIFKNYFRKRQISRTDLQLEDKEIEEILEEQRIGYTALRMIKTGFQCSLSILQYANLEWKKRGTTLEVLIEPSLENLKPDYVIIRKKIDSQYENNYSIQNIKFLCIGDIKSYTYFVNITRERLLQDYIEQLVVDDFSKTDLAKLNLDKKKKAPARDFYRIVTSLQKYLKVFGYLKLYYNETQNYNDEIEVQVVLPGAISSFLIHSEDDLRKTLKFLEGLIPDIIEESEYGKKTFHEFNDLDKKRLFNLLMSGKISMRKEEDKNNNNTTFYIFQGTRGEELKLIFKEEKKVLVESFSQTRNEQIPRIVKRHKLSLDGLKKIRSEHEKEFLNLLLEENNNLIINGSSQGVGKNYIFAKYINELLKIKDEFTIIFFCPRIATLIQTRDEVRELLDKNSKNKIHLELSVGKREKELIRDQITIKEFEEIQESSSSRLKKILAQPGRNLILVTAQALDYFLKQSSNWKFLFNKSYMLVFDELSNSGPTVTKNFIDLIRELNIQLLRSKNSNSTRFLVMDASITSKNLFVSMLNDLVNPESNKWMTQFQITNINEKISESEKFEIYNTAIKGVYLRRSLDFNIDYGIASYICNWEYESPQNFKYISEIVSKLVKDSRVCAKDKTFGELLKEGKVIFYVNNKKFVDALVEYFHLENFSAFPITHDSRDILLVEGIPKKNIIVA